jgi:hypothetical protein
MSIKEALHYAGLMSANIDRLTRTAYHATHPGKVGTADDSTTAGFALTALIDAKMNYDREILHVSVAMKDKADRKLGSAKRHKLRRLEEAAGALVQRVNENPNEECPFCAVLHQPGGADHEEDCPIERLSSALSTAPAEPKAKGKRKK